MLTLEFLQIDTKSEGGLILPSFVIDTEECQKANAGNDRTARVGILVW